MATTIDRRRNNGPQSSYKPRFESDTSTNQSPALKNEFFLTCGFIHHATGSSFYESGETKIIGCIQGPRPTFKQVSGSAHYGVVTVQVCRQSGHSSHVLANLVARAVEKSIVVHKYPKSELYVAIQVLQEPLKISQNDDDEDDDDEEEEVVVGCIMAASSALVDAGIQMYDIVSAASLFLINGQIKSIPPPHHHHNSTRNNDDDNRAVGMVVAYMPNREEVTLMHLTGPGAHQDDIDLLLKAAIKHAQAVHVLMTRVLTQS